MRMWSVRARSAVAAVALATTAVISAGSAIAQVDQPDGPASTSDGADEPIAVAEALAGSSSAMVAIDPVRVLDTRASSTFSRLPANGSLAIDPLTSAVLGAAGVSAGDVEAVAFNLTAVRAGGRGFVKAWPATDDEPTTSNVNPLYAGHTIPNLVTMRLGGDGRIRVKASVAADIIIDVQAVYVRATSAGPGRFQPLPPQRAFDSRGGAPLAANGSVVVDLTASGVPTSAMAAIVNVTATQTPAGGHYTVYVPGGGVPNASTLNVPGAGTNVANQAIARLSNGQMAVFSKPGGHVVVDLIGYVTGAGAGTSSDGLFVPVTPARFVDTRDTARFTPECTLRFTIAGRDDVPAAGVAAMVSNVTATQAAGRGFLTLTAWNTGDPGVSTVNMLGAGHTVANHATSVVANGSVQVLASEGSDVILDIVGYYTGPNSSPDFEAHTGQCVPAVPGYPGSGANAFLYARSGGGFSRWDPCRTLEYRVNLVHAPDQEAIDSMNEAILMIEEATGIDFVYRGSTTAGLDMSRQTDIDAIIGFSRPEANPELSGSVIGIGGGYYSNTRVVYGYAFADVTDGLGSGDRLRAVFLHELGHMMGLAHVSDPNQLMYGFATSRTDLNIGDLEGLWEMGSAQGCLASGQLSTTDSLVPPVIYHAHVADVGHSD